MSTGFNSELVLMAVRRELESAMAQHKSLNSLHEGYSVLLEEVDEVWDEVKAKRELRRGKHIAKELVQVAAMAVRMIIDCGLTGQLNHHENITPCLLPKESEK